MQCIPLQCSAIERIHSRVHSRVRRFIGAKESVYIRKELNSYRTGLVHRHNRRLIVLEHNTAPTTSCAFVPFDTIEFSVLTSREK